MDDTEMLRQELDLLIVSLKIIWMIHRQSRMEDRARPP